MTAGPLTPAAQTTRSASMRRSTSSDTPCASTPTTFVPVRTSTPRLLSLASTECEIFSGNGPRTLAVVSIKVSRKWVRVTSLL